MPSALNSLDRLDKFMNVDYVYVDQHDTFIARGLQLNMLRENVNDALDLLDANIYTLGSGVTIGETPKTVILGGEITEDAIIVNDEGVYDFYLQSAQVIGTRSGRVSIKNGMINVSTYFATDYTNSNGYAQLLAKEDTVSLISWSAGWLKNAIDISPTSMLITDGINSLGLQYLADYSTAGLALGARWIPDKGAVDALIDADVTVVTDALAAGTQAVHYDCLTNLPNDGYRIVKFNLDYTDPDNPQMIINLPTGAVVHDILVYLITVFNDTSANLLSVAGPGSPYINAEAGLLTGSTGVFKTSSLSGLPNRMVGVTDITATFIDGDGDASTGSVDIYIVYSLH